MWHKFLLVSLCLLLGACATGGYGVTVSPNKLLPNNSSNNSKLKLGQDLVLKPGDTLVSTPVGVAFAATLEQDITVKIADKTGVFPAGTRLRGGLTNDRMVAFCAEEKTNLGKSLVTLATLGLSSTIMQSTPITRFCLVDRDNNGKMDAAFLVGARRKQDQGLFPINEITIKPEKDVVLPGKSEARIYYKGPGILGTGKFIGGLPFQLEVIENGVPLNFDNGRIDADPKKLPVILNTFGGVQFEVLSYDAVSKNVTVRVLRNFQPSEYGITTVVR